MKVNSTVLALSDAAHKSDGAVQLAGLLAARFDMQLHVVHAMELTHRSLRAVFPVLDNIDHEVKAADAILQEQVERLVPRSVGVTSVVSMLDPLRAIERRAAEVLPQITVTAPGLRWSTVDRRALTASRCLRLKSPLCIVRTDARARSGKLLVVTHAEVFREALVSAAARWGKDIAGGAGDSEPVGAPPILLLADDESTDQVLSRVDKYDADMIVFDLQTFQVSSLMDRLDSIVSALLSRTTATILLLP
jgi:hypothetical protein